MSLRTAIDRLQASEQDRLAIKDDKDAFLSEWRSDLTALYTNLIGFLKEYIDDRSVKVFGFGIEVKEDWLGEYEAPALRIDVTNKSVKCTPRGRLSANSTGRLDLWRSDRPSVTDRIRIVRNIAPGGNKGHWTIQSVGSNSTKSNRVTLPEAVVGGLVASWVAENREYTYYPLDQQSFEDALERLLSL